MARCSGNTAQMAGFVFDSESRVDERVDRLSPSFEVVRGKKAFDRLSELIARHDAEKRRGPLHELRVDRFVVGHVRQRRRFEEREALGNAAHAELI